MNRRHLAQAIRILVEAREFGDPAPHYDRVPVSMNRAQARALLERLEVLERLEAMDRLVVPGEPRTTDGTLARRVAAARRGKV